MTMAAPMDSVARSSLEEMLELLRRSDDYDKPKDLPPALPARPPSKARLPTARRFLPASLASDGSNNVAKECGVGDVEKATEDAQTKRETEIGSRINSFGSRKMMDENLDSPYVNEERHTNVGEGTTSRSGGVAEWEDNIEYFIKKKLRVWCRPANGQWEMGLIASASGEEAVVSLLSGNVVRVSKGELLPANPDILHGVDDLLQLSYLNEPSVIHNLQYRYNRDKIYSKAGPVLIAVNPFKKVQLYGDSLVQAYKQKATDNAHVYAIADTAYNEMMKDNINQSIIISGESGAGKTETAKIAMQYLASLGGGSTVGVQSEILHTNSILEAFGNAKTSRNDNSSRFGKFIEIHFSISGKICCAKIQTCSFLLFYMEMRAPVITCAVLLEKSRVVQLAPGERSYHIFYQLCAGAPSYLREKLNLKSAGDYYYLKQSNCLVIDRVDDAKQFQILLEVLNIVRIPKDYQENAFAVLAAILWLGNISFKAIDHENHAGVVADEAVSTVARLLGCASEDLVVALSTRIIKAGKDNITKKLTLQQAFDTRDALAKFLYASLFDWILEQVNKSLEVGKKHTGRSINILDIYGFESFERNSFEQFCINYANERLQQHFNRHLFKLEQEDYEVDGIDWTKVEFEDNEDCLNLIEKRPLGVVSLLDEESNFPKASDLTFAHKLKQHLGSNPCFKGDRGASFTLRHYAGEVSYDTTGFLEKNRDPLHSDSVRLLSSCSFQLCKLFVSRIHNHSPNSGSNHSGGLESQKQSVATKFKGQLFNLMHQLEATKPHFIRCIKPNGKQLPGHYEEELVLQQLRCCGVIEVVRISRSGYPSRMTHQEFAASYGFMLLDSVTKDALSISVAVLHQFNIPPEMYQVGYTKLYLRMGQVAILENRRKHILERIIVIQKCYRCYQARLRYCSLKKGATVLQSFIRGDIARRNYSAVLAKAFAAASAATNDRLVAIVRLQSVIRGRLVRGQFHDLLGNNHLESKKATQKSTEKDGEAKASKKELDLASKQVEIIAAEIEELRLRVFEAESTQAKKEEENAALREELQQVRKRWSDYESRTKVREETWQKQIASLQMSLATARKSLASEDHNKPKRFDAFTSPHGYDSDTTSMGTRTPVGNWPRKYPTGVPDGRAGHDTNRTLTAMNDLLKEFEVNKQTFDDEARIMAASNNSSPEAELRGLKLRFRTWKKDYKARLREMKARLRKLGLYESSRRKWWTKMR
ncbi:hypothetical protein MLD38_027112 [Melastoma candidum]|uniref:Uncharacterized protein n=1 Tax=Melastoma candidum TaxID=119954 RepID=A0ACB9P6U3_9MYRT|nr:hypothetical protein MLD38_027112 [Melastoma candidum]